MDHQTKVQHAAEAKVADILRNRFGVQTGQIAKLLNINPRSVLRRLEKYDDDSYEIDDLLDQEGYDHLGEYSMGVHEIAGESVVVAEFVFNEDLDGTTHTVLIDEVNCEILFDTVDEGVDSKPVATPKAEVSEEVDFQAMILPSVLVVVRDGKPLQIDKKHKFFDKIAALIADNVSGNKLQLHIRDQIYDLIDLKQSLQEYSEGKVKVTADGVFLDGRLVDGRLSDRLMSAVFDGVLDANTTLKGLANFMAKLEENPSNRVVGRLYDFLKANDIRINDDGDVVTLKVVRDNYKDKYTGTMDNSPGTFVSVPRNQVDDRDENTCSNGLHVCSIKYFVDGPYYNEGDTVVECLVHPKDWVSIPVDYDNSKARVCAYKVTRDITDDIPALMEKYRNAARV